MIVGFVVVCALALAPALPWAHAVGADRAARTESKTAILQLAGLRDKVMVRYDQRGIPHIAAKNEADLFFAQGYVTAKDRLWQMDLLRRTGRGQLSELFGDVVLDQD
ncbi:MAG TPA: penicillin acylase family protein, partial [Blastocatellia bacterium]|nr:penicillin acylase family protein [Blastocatellia bacterium]